MTVASAVKLKKLLYVLAQSVPFKPNYYEVGERFGYQPECVARLHELFGEGRSGNLLRERAQGLKLLEKVERSI